MLRRQVKPGRNTRGTIREYEDKKRVERAEKRKAKKAQQEVKQVERQEEK